MTIPLSPIIHCTARYGYFAERSVLHESKQRPKNPSSASRNLFVIGKKQREERQKKIRAEAVQMVMTAQKKNEQRIIQELLSIDFKDSPIPPEILEHRSTDGQACGDLEHAAKTLIQHMKSARDFHVATKSIDKLLLEFAEEFKCAVQSGYVQTALTAKAGLMKWTLEIRNALPYMRREEALHYVAYAETFMGTWRRLLDYANALDHQDKVLRMMSLDAKALREQRRNQLDEEQNELQNDEEKLQELHKLDQEILYIMGHVEAIGLEKQLTETKIGLLQREADRMAVPRIDVLHSFAAAGREPCSVDPAVREAAERMTGRELAAAIGHLELLELDSAQEVLES